MLNQIKLTITIIFWALMASRFILGIVHTEYFNFQISEIEDRSLLYILISVAIVLAAVSHFLHIKSYDIKFLEKRAILPSNAPVPLDSRNWSEEDFHKWKMMQSFQVMSILSWAISESIAILGFISPNFGATDTEVISFIGASILIGLMHRPKIDKLKIK